VSVAADVLDVIVLRGGTLRPRKGINVVEHPVQLERLSSADLASVEASAHSEPVAYAFSFMKDGNEADWIRRIVPHAPVIGKLERHEAIINVAAIAGAVDAIWVCRGDLGAQLGLGPMARWVSGFDPRTMPCPVSMAGQVLEHVTAHAVPTRAEVCNICDLVARGYRGFVLSDETATGTDPAGAVRTLRTLLCEMQEP
jgi:pyruvate kinase